MSRRIVGISVVVALLALLVTGALSASQQELVDELLSEDVSPQPSPQPVAEPPAQAGVLGALAAVVSGRSAGVDDRPERELHLTVPPHAPLLSTPTAHLPAEVPEGQIRAHAYQYVSRVFERPRKDPTALGFVRRGMVLQADGRGFGPGCDGLWYTLAGGGYVCTRDGFSVSRTPQTPVARQLPPRVAEALPYRYGKARSHDVLRYYELPTAAQQKEALAALAAGQRLPDVAERTLDGVFLLAIDREEGQGDRRFLRTVRGRYVAAADVEPKPLPGMRGELISADNPLPIAFVYGEDAEGQTAAPLLRRSGATERVVGSADKHARFGVKAETKWAERTMVESSEGFAAPRARLRIARKIARPEKVGPADKWIHINLDEQTLVAYEGDRPVFATLVSSGKGAEFATPKGLFQVREKHISATMSGPDPDEGYYEVEEVPWTQYYYDSFALHGAYWHDDFGKTRSHGCTNIAPVDARWLFYWTDDALPAGWHALRKLRGTQVYFTRDLPPA